MFRLARNHRRQFRVVTVKVHYISGDALQQFGPTARFRIAFERGRKSTNKGTTDWQPISNGRLVWDESFTLNCTLFENNGAYLKKNVKFRLEAASNLFKQSFKPKIKTIAKGSVDLAECYKDQLLELYPRLMLGKQQLVMHIRLSFREWAASDGPRDDQTDTGLTDASGSEHDDDDDENSLASLTHGASSPQGSTSPTTGVFDVSERVGNIMGIRRESPFLVDAVVSGPDEGGPSNRRGTAREVMPDASFVAPGRVGTAGERRPEASLRGLDRRGTTVQVKSDPEFQSFRRSTTEERRPDPASQSLRLGAAEERTCDAASKSLRTGAIQGDRPTLDLAAQALRRGPTEDCMPKSTAPLETGSKDASGVSKWREQHTFKPGGSTAPAGGGWVCGNCSYRNLSPASVVCAVCLLPKGPSPCLLAQTDVAEPRRAQLQQYLENYRPPNVSAGCDSSSELSASTACTEFTNSSDATRIRTMRHQPNTSRPEHMRGHRSNGTLQGPRCTHNGNIGHNRMGYAVQNRFGTEEDSVSESSSTFMKGGWREELQRQKHHQTTRPIFEAEEPWLKPDLKGRFNDDDDLWSELRRSKPDSSPDASSSECSNQTPRPAAVVQWAASDEDEGNDEWGSRCIENQRLHRGSSARTRAWEAPVEGSLRHHNGDQQGTGGSYGKRNGPNRRPTFVMGEVESDTGSSPRSSGSERSFRQQSRPRDPGIWATKQHFERKARQQYAR